jgi:hypothetical protein
VNRCGAPMNAGTRSSRRGHEGAIGDLLLRGPFQRTPLRIAYTADLYVDYDSLGHPHRRLQHPPSCTVDPRG